MSQTNWKILETWMHNLYTTPMVSNATQKKSYAVENWLFSSVNFPEIVPALAHKAYAITNVQLSFNEVTTDERGLLLQLLHHKFLVFSSSRDKSKTNIKLPLDQRQQRKMNIAGNYNVSR